MAMTALDYEEIRQLQARYNFALDFGDAAAFGDCFTPDGTLWERAMPPGLQTELRLQGRPGLGEFAIDFFANHSGHLRHWTSSGVIDGDGQYATGLSFLTVLRAGWAPYTGVILTGINRDRYTKVDDRWYIVAGRSSRIRNRRTATPPRNNP